MQIEHKAKQVKDLVPGDFARIHKEDTFVQCVRNDELYSFIIYKVGSIPFIVQSHSGWLIKPCHVLKAKIVVE